MKLTRKQLLYGEMLPRWYRIAYVNSWTGMAYAYPVGVHWVVMFGRRLWMCSYWYRPSWIEQLQTRVDALQNENRMLRALLKSSEEKVSSIEQRLSNMWTPEDY